MGAFRRASEGRGERVGRGGSEEIWGFKSGGGALRLGSPAWGPRENLGVQIWGGCLMHKKFC